VTTSNSELRNTEGNEQRNQEIKQAAVLVDKNKEIEILKQAMMLKDESIASLSAKVDEYNTEINRKVEDYNAIMEDHNGKCRVIDRLRAELTDASNKCQTIDNLTDENKVKDGRISILTAQLPESSRTKPTLTNRVTVVEEDSVRYQEEATLLKKKVDTRTILVQIPIRHTRQVCEKN
jgi:hypothetical protein